jgi:hypothetical protein
VGGKRQQDTRQGIRIRRVYLRLRGLSVRPIHCRPAPVLRPVAVAA